MNRRTRQALSAINRRFYSASADEFSRTRFRPWQGWGRVAEELARRCGESPVTVLDVGCGNGRFGVLLDQRLGRPVSYLGVDGSRQLLAVAAQRLAGLQRLRLVEHDFVEEPLSDALPDERFHMVALFGVLHHLPSADLRCEVLRQLGRRVADGGLLVVSSWRFVDQPRFFSRSIPWAEHNRTAAEPIDEDQLEPGDLLLRWGEQDARRYCHQVDDEEEARLIAATGLPLVRRYHADGATGRLNRYLLFAG